MEKGHFWLAEDATLFPTGLPLQVEISEVGEGTGSRYVLLPYGWDPFVQFLYFTAPSKL